MDRHPRRARIKAEIRIAKWLEDMGYKKGTAMEENEGFISDEEEEAVEDAQMVDSVETRKFVFLVMPPPEEMTTETKEQAEEATATISTTTSEKKRKQNYAKYLKRKNKRAKLAEAGVDTGHIRKRLQGAVVEKFDNSVVDLGMGATYTSGTTRLHPDLEAIMVKARVYIRAGCDSVTLDKVHPAMAVDQDDRILVYRAYGSANTLAVHVPALDGAIKYLKENIKEQQSSSYKRGEFGVWMFGVHRGSAKAPIASSHLSKHRDLVARLSQILSPVVDHLSKVFKSIAPDMHEMYTTTTRAAYDHAGIPLLWGPWSMLCINHDKALLIPHKDRGDFRFGWCCIVCTGKFDWKKSLYLCIDLGKRVLCFALPPGIPIFLPSSLFLHFNSWFVGDDGFERHSFVFWLPGAVVQWHVLGGRTKGSLTREESKEYLNRCFENWSNFLSNFPKI